MVKRLKGTLVETAATCGRFLLQTTVQQIISGLIGMLLAHYVAGLLR
jgi:hypothetical protein